MQSTTLASIQMAHASITGAREQNEDASGRLVLHDGEFVFIWVCDGHGGAKLAADFSASFQQYLLEGSKEHLFRHGVPCADVTPDTLARVLQSAYDKAVADVDKAIFFGQQGTTVSAALLHTRSMTLATLQLGDSRIAAVDVCTGTLCTDERGEPCVTTSHDFSDPLQQERYNRELARVSQGDLHLDFQRRPDAAAIEKRFKAKIVSKSMNRIIMTLVEPAGTLEDLATYQCLVRSHGQEVYQAVVDLQRKTEIKVWSLRHYQGRPLAVFAGCDGFVSKKALPTPERWAQMLTNWGAYTGNHDSLLSDTVLEDWMVKKDGQLWDASFASRDSEAFQRNPLGHICDRVRNVAPDDDWRMAVAYSYRCVQEVYARYLHKGRLPSFRENPQLNVSLGVHLPVLLGGDDNVTLEAMFIEEFGKECAAANATEENESVRGAVCA